MLIESWDTDYLADQEKVFGRAKNSGAPLTGAHEFDTPNLSAEASTARRSSTCNAHIRLAAPASNGGQMILRRGYSYTDGIDQQHRAARRRACSSSPTRRIRASSSCRSSDGSGSTTCSTSTSGTPAARCSPCRPGCAAAGDYYGKSLFA